MEIFEGICAQDPNLIFLGRTKETRERVSMLDNENSNLKEMRERISLLERKNSSLRKQETDWK